MRSDQISIFSYDGEAESDNFSLQNLNDVVQTHFDKRCILHKLAEGGYHKVYDIVEKHRNSLNAVARVTSPAFPVDKLLSDSVATLKYISSRTKIPVPEVYLWNCNANNKVGADYMIMQKMFGVSASAVWDSLSVEKRSAGSLYMIGGTQEPNLWSALSFSTPLYRALDGFVRPPYWESYSEGIHSLRGPFQNVTDYIKSPLLAELHFISQHPSIALEESGSEKTLQQGQRVLKKALDLCSVFPGNRQVYAPATSEENLFPSC